MDLNLKYKLTNFVTNEVLFFDFDPTPEDISKAIINANWHSVSSGKSCLIFKYIKLEKLKK